jgi:glycerol-3-phosphate acyltransferase PlsY
VTSASGARGLVLGMSAHRSSAWLIAIAAILGTAASVYNYFSPDSGIDGTGGVVLVIASSAVLFVLGLGLGMGASRLSLAGSRALAAAALFLILGTAFAAYLLESQALLALMVVCSIGWLVHVVTPRHATA